MHGMTDMDKMFSVRIAPWHLEETNSVVLDDHPDPAEVLQHAGLTWHVVERDLYRQVDVDGDRLGIAAIGGWKLLVRDDTNTELHIARDSYGVVQNEVGARIMDALLGADNAVKYETGGSIEGGKTCYLTAYVDEPTTIKGDDSATYPYCVVTWAHDGTAAMVARATNIRVVCWNTLSASEAQAEATGRTFTFRHTVKVLDRIEQAREAIFGVREEHKAFVELANELADIAADDDARERFVRSFIPEPEARVVSDRVIDNITRERNKVRALFDGPTIPDAHRNTAYGLVLAGGEYLDHLRTFRNNNTYLGRTLLKDNALKMRLFPLAREVVNA